jgi:hypothetical protein
LGEKNALRIASESQPAQANYCRSIYSDHSGSKSRMVSNGFWHIVSIVKEREPPVQQKGFLTTE